MKRPKIYVTGQFPQKGIDVLLRRCNVAMWGGSECVPRRELLQNIQGTGALLCVNRNRIDVEVLDAAGPSLKVIGTMSEKSEHIDIEECAKRGIDVITMPRISAESIADLTLANCSLIIQSAAKGKTIDISKMTSAPDFSDKTLGIVGIGNVGFAIAERLKKLGLPKIVYNDISEIQRAEDIEATSVTFEELIETSDIVCVCCTNCERTVNLFNKDAFMKMKNSAILIDVTRGHSINYSDLYEALRGNIILAAGVDIRGHGQIPFNTLLQGLSNCFFIPYQEVNHTWDRRSEQSATMANLIVKGLEKEQT